MMIDGSGCRFFLCVIALIGFLIGLIAVWIGAPWWAPLMGVFVPPLILVAIAAVAGIFLWRESGTNAGT